MVKTLTGESIDRAVEYLKAGELVAFPTETVYGLGADATSPEAVAKIFELKGRPSDHPLIVHVASAAAARLWVREFGEHAEKLAKAFWPGPLTMVLAKNGRVASEAVGGKTTIAIRVPNHPLALQLLESFGGGIAGPSANMFGKVSPTSAAHVAADLGDSLGYVLDGGKCKVGVESTIIDLTGAPTLLRPGGVSVEAMNKVLGLEVVDGTAGESRAPGMMKSHYAPNAKIRIVALEELQAEDFEMPDNAGVVAPVVVEGAVSWTMPQDAEGYARGLYAVLREADYKKLDTLFIVPPSEGDIIEAVLDRLTKAAAPRVK